MFLVLIRICFFICLFVGLLKVRKTSFRHVPTRRTRISRHYGETTLWVERLANALMDMLHSTATAAAAAAPGTTAAGSPVSSAGSAPSTGFNTPTAERPFGSRLPQVGSSAAGLASSPEGAHLRPSLSPAWQASQPTHRHPRYDATTGLWEDELYTDREEERRSPHAGLAGLPIVEKLEERINAVLEDSGIATWADFRIHAIGDSPPCIKAIHVVQGGQNSNTNNNNNSNNSNTGNNNTGGVDDGNLSGNGTIGGQGSSTGVFSPSMPKNSTFAPGGAASSVGGAGGNNSSADPDAPLDYSRHNNNNNNNNNSTNTNAGASSGLSGLRSSSSFYSKLNQSILGGATTEANNNNSISGGNNNSAINNNSPPYDPTSLEMELEVEYTGSFDVTLKADLSFARGRQLPIYVHIGDLKYLRAHLRLLTKLQYESATMESPQKPYLQCTLFFESDPMFDMRLHTSLTRFNIQDFILIPFFAKFFLLRFIRKRMRRSHEQADAGVRFKIPLPEDIVDGGDQSWCAPLGRDTMSEETARASATPWFRGRSFQ